MATESEYDMECKRADLLGIPRPDKELFSSLRQAKSGEAADTNEEGIQELNQQGESIGRAAGGVDELNNILAVTQKKINHLSTFCGSFKGLRRFRPALVKRSSSDRKREISSTENVSFPNATSGEMGVEGSNTAEKWQRKKPELETTVGSQIDKLDTILLKTERADIALSSQNKQMKKFFRK